VLDNFEQLLHTAPGWLTDLLARCPRSTALVTSRTALNVDGEYRYELAPLSVVEPHPVPGASAPPAVRLFTERARAIRPGFALDETNREVVTEICQRLDGLPLAIELAASRIGAFTPADMLARMSKRFTLLGGGRRGAPPHLRSMRDAIAWSHDLLTPGEQTLLRRLAVFVGGFTLEAAEAVCGGDERPDERVLTGLSALVDHSLVQRVAIDRGAGRYRMLETIRDFAADRLADSGEEVQLRDRHAQWVLALAQGTRAHTDALEQALAIDPLVAEQPNIDAALHWVLESGQGERLADLIVALEHYWNYARPAVEALAWYQRALSDGAGSLNTRIDLLNVAALLAHTLGDPVADSYLAELGALVDDIGSPLQRANAAFMMALRAEDQGDYSQAGAGFHIAQTRSRDAGDAWLAVQCEYHLGVVAYGERQFDRAVDRLTGARAAAMAINDPFTSAWCLVYLVFIACERGDVQGAVAHLRMHPDINRDAANPRQRLDHEHEPLVRAAAAVVASARGQHHLAARLLGSAVHEVPLREPELRIAEQCRKAACRALGDAEFTRLWDAGYRMRPEDVQADFDRTLADDDAPAGNVAVREATHGLSSREVEVVRLLADGLTNQEIADTLFVSLRTAATHVDHILTKLGVRSRTAAVAFAIRNGLA
jgi:non-specific serine/threonine protein kinase